MCITQQPFNNTFIIHVMLEKIQKCKRNGSVYKTVKQHSELQALALIDYNLHYLPKELLQSYNNSQTFHQFIH